MNTHCKICGKRLLITPEFDTCMECQSKEVIRIGNLNSPTECYELKAKVKRYFDIEKEAIGFHKTDNWEALWEEFLKLRDEIILLVGIE